MAYTTKKANGYASAFTSGTMCTPIVKHFEVALTSATADTTILLEAALDGYVVPAGGAALTGDMGGTTPKVAIKYGANNSTDLMTAADPSTGVLESTVATGVPAGTASASASLWLDVTSGASDATGTILVTVMLVPLATKPKRAGVGV